MVVGKGVSYANYHAGVRGSSTIYTILVFLRILLTWFEANDLGRPYRVISQMTDPYLNWFRVLEFSYGGNGFSPLVAMAVLALINNILLNPGDLWPYYGGHYTFSGPFKSLVGRRLYPCFLYHRPSGTAYRVYCGNQFGQSPVEDPGCAG